MSQKEKDRLADLIIKKMFGGYLKGSELVEYKRLKIILNNS